MIEVGSKSLAAAVAGCVCVLFCWQAELVQVRQLRCMQRSTSLVVARVRCVTVSRKLTSLSLLSPVFTSAA